MLKKQVSKRFRIGGVLIIVVVVAVGLASWAVYHRSHKTKTTTNANTTSSNQTQTKTDDKTNQKTTTDSTTATKPTDPYAGWKTYTSKVGNLTLKYPANWDLSDPGLADRSQMDGNNNNVRLQSSPSSKSNNFGVNLHFSDSPGTNTPYNSYGNGTTALLANSITLWEEKQNVNWATGPATVDCPIFKIGTDNSYSMKLSSGKYMTAEGSFCWGQGLTSSYDYSHQRSSTEWADAVNIIKSIKFN